MPATETRPHANNSGLRGHSIGDIYPWSIVVYGDPFGPNYRLQAVNLVTGERCPVRRIYRRDNPRTGFKIAHDLAETDAKLRLEGYHYCPECHSLHDSKAAAVDCCTLPEYLRR